ncbi:MAG: DUF6179 domain-containing protein, partial [Limnochordia bacterium]|nr:DUF6179 domain-containing protein [Limnochordia bacterium]
MGNIERRQLLDRNRLSGESYLASLLQEGHACGALSDSDLESIQLQCIKFLAHKSEEYNDSFSSSLRVETAESIMKSNLYTIGLYLKSLPDIDSALGELRTMPITEMYRKGRRLINAKFHAARHLYELTQNNRLSTDNYTYSATLTDTGIGLFFRVYDPDYKAHEFPASIDYQLCHPVTDLVGVEFIQKYLENLYLENEFCGYFTAEDIHRLLLGYDPGYRDLPVNIFEHVLGAVLGCVLVERDLRALHISPEDVQLLQNRLSGPDDATLVMGLCMASGIILEELSIASPALQRYINQTLDKVKASIVYALKTHTLDKVFAPSTNRQVKQGIRFVSSAKMD